MGLRGTRYELRLYARTCTSTLYRKATREKGLYTRLWRSASEGSGSEK